MSDEAERVIRRAAAPLPKISPGRFVPQPFTPGLYCAGTLSGFLVPLCVC